jgi:hypothetical protein
MKASLGAVSGVAVLVTQSGAGPDALVAVQPAGNAGAVTPSKFWLNTLVGVPTTEVEAEAERRQPPVQLTDALFMKVIPQDPALVPLTT